MGTASVLYRLALLVHIVAAIVGFGALLSAGIVHARAFRSPAAEAVPLLATARSIRRVGEVGLWLLLALGIVLVSLSDGAIGFGAAWISAAFVVWALLVAAMHGLVLPGVRALHDRAGELAATGGAAPLDADPGTAGPARRLAIGEALVQLLLVAALALMIWQPGN